LTGKRVLVAEDDFLVAMDMRRTIEEAGGTVASSERTAKSVVDAAENETLDCAVLDVQLDDGMVFAAARALRRRRVPFVLVTGYERSMIPAELADVPYLQKPVSRATLVECVVDCVASAISSKGMIH
jgi:two-component SAPR family response regulator